MFSDNAGDNVTLTFYNLTLTTITSVIVAKQPALYEVYVFSITYRFSNNLLKKKASLTSFTLLIKLF